MHVGKSTTGISIHNHSLYSLYRSLKVNTETSSITQKQWL